MTPTMRIGHGFDIHRLQPGGHLLIGGVLVAENMSLVAHSDGDVAIHALVDAIFGALGVGDIGEHFPDSDADWKGRASEYFLAAAVEIAARHGYAVASGDVTVQAEKPKLKPFKHLMREKLSALCHAPVNVKAGTNEGMDAVGRGEAIAAHAVVLLVRTR